jgi:hypothetical protein
MQFLQASDTGIIFTSQGAAVATGAGSMRSTPMVNAAAASPAASFLISLLLWLPEALGWAVALLYVGGGSARAVLTVRLRWMPWRILAALGIAAPITSETAECYSVRRYGVLGNHRQQVVAAGWPVALDGVAGFRVNFDDVQQVLLTREVWVDGRV